MFVNKIWSSKTQLPYSYYSLPFCKPACVFRRWRPAPERADLLFLLPPPFSSGAAPAPATRSRLTPSLPSPAPAPSSRATSSRSQGDPD
jgi:hypothetical protein